MVFINSLFNQDAGVPIFPTEFIEDISKIRNDCECFNFYDLNLFVYDKINEFSTYEQLKYLFGGYTKSTKSSNEILLNTYRYEAVPTVEFITYLIYYNDLNNEKVLKSLNGFCKEYGLELEYTVYSLQELISCLKYFAFQINSLPDDIIYLNMDSVASVGVGLLFSSFIKEKKIIAIGNQINVPEVANFAISLNVIHDIKNTHINKVYDSRKFIETLELVKNRINFYPLYYGLRIIPFKLTEGCTQKCNFCTERMYWSCFGEVVDNFKKKNTVDLLEELKYIINDFGVDGITFNDCMIDFSLPEFSDIVALIIKNKIFCSGSTRADCLNADKIHLLSKMNFTNLIIGLETFNESSVRVYSKGNSNYLNDFERTFKLLKESGIEPQINIVLGHPFENQEDVLKSIEEDALSLRKMKKHNLFILDLSIGDMLINYPSKNYFDIKENEGFEIVYHSINDDNIDSNIKNAVNCIPSKAHAKYETKINKLDCISSLSEIMDFGTDILKRVTNLTKHWLNLDRVWRKRKVYIKTKIILNELIREKGIFSEIMNNQIIKYEILTESLDDIQELVNTLLIMYFMNLIEFVEGD